MTVSHKPEAKNDVRKSGIPNMKIVEYNEVDPYKVLYLNQLALGFALTPEKVVHLRQSDPRPFPCLAIYAVEGDTIMGQVGIFCLPMISIKGREDVGGIWAVSTHPQFSRRGVASTLIAEAHARMQKAGLRFSTLGTNRSRVAYKLYQQNGYEETNVWATAFAPWETAHQPTRLRAQPLGLEGYDLVEQIFSEIAQDYLGFAWRYSPFEPLRRLNPSDIWILRENNNLVGYSIAHTENNLLTISNILLRISLDVTEAVSAVVAELKSTYVRVTVSRPIEITDLKRAGYYVAHPNWNSFMIKPLLPGLSISDARRHFGIGTDRFLISWLDET
jgi:ribosomal protein S18 acetylase RimI-like enzyme